MKNDIPRLLPLWFILILVVLFAMCGCKTGGKRLNPNSAGKIVRTSEPRERVLPPKTTHLPTPETNTGEIPKPTLVTPAKAVRSTPTPMKPKSAEATLIKETIKGVGETKPFKPTVSVAPTKLPPIAATNSITNSLILSEGKNKNGEIIICKESPQKSKINWVQLFSFFMMLFTSLLILWVLYDIIKDSLEMKKQGSPIKKHLENLKKPAKGTKAERKKTIKKKITKKKSK